MAYSEKGNYRHHNHHRAFIEHKHPGAVLRAFNMKCAKSITQRGGTITGEDFSRCTDSSCNLGKVPERVDGGANTIWLRTCTF